ncbi:hypothetical protein CSOJ01_02975 [Colletotrichum sojae]|uniref:Uncharacterized protein n=1 Tax=Colletotrichum sojae TaxID=2175907 RepID=A0A8H6JNY1_9PEZI|nr:hypothetical protein CSOJ01_02975 [Colletotrichum sojae]
MRTLAGFEIIVNTIDNSIQPEPPTSDTARITRVSNFTDMETYDRAVDGGGDGRHQDDLPRSEIMTNDAMHLRGGMGPKKRKAAKKAKKKVADLTSDDEYNEGPEPHSQPSTSTAQAAPAQPQALRRSARVQSRQTGGDGSADTGDPQAVPVPVAAGDFQAVPVQVSTETPSK